MNKGNKFSIWERVHVCISLLRITIQYRLICIVLLIEITLPAPQWSLYGADITLMLQFAIVLRYLYLFLKKEKIEIKNQNVGRQCI